MDGCWIANISISFISFLTVVVCPNLQDPPNGIVNLSMGTVFESQATYTCSGGLILSGNDTRTCEANGQWSGSEPTCGKQQSIFISYHNPAKQICSKNHVHIE